jgi:hypothetical protein
MAPVLNSFHFSILNTTYFRIKSLHRTCAVLPLQVPCALPWIFASGRNTAVISFLPWSDKHRLLLPLSVSHAQHQRPSRSWPVSVLSVWTLCLDESGCDRLSTGWGLAWIRNGMGPDPEWNGSWSPLISRLVLAFLDYHHMFVVGCIYM